MTKFPLMKAESLTKMFGGLVAIKNVSFDLNEGELLGLIGPNGSGKTTLFNVISGYYHPERGSIYYKGKNIVGLKPFQICKKGVARTFQIVKPLSSMSVLDNVMTAAFMKEGHVPTARKKALEVLEYVELINKKESFPSGLTVSARKRLEIARALALEPELLLLDETLAGLNASEIDHSIKLIKSIHNRGITIIMVEHVMRAIMSLSQRIIVLDHGEMIAQGIPEEIAHDKKVIGAYLGREYASAGSK